MEQRFTPATKFFSPLAGRMRYCFLKQRQYTTAALLSRAPPRSFRQEGARKVSGALDEVCAALALLYLGDER